MLEKAILACSDLRVTTEPLFISEPVAGSVSTVPKGSAYRLIGVGIADLCDGHLAEDGGGLLDPMAARRAGAERAADAIRARFGREAIIKGRSLR